MSDLFEYPRWIADPKQYEIEQERYRHDQALYSFGEYAMFVLLWDIEDLTAGLVDRCPTCYKSYGKIAEAYGQSATQHCADCFGTTFEGGYKAKIVRQSMWDTNERTESFGVRGEADVSTSSIQSTSDFRMRKGDYVFRADGTRWVVTTRSTNHLRTGFMMPTTERTALGFNFGEVRLEDEAMPVYQIPPSTAVLLTELDVTHLREPKDFSALEDIRGPLVFQ